MKGRLETCLDHQYERAEHAFIPERLLHVGESHPRLVSRDHLLRRNKINRYRKPQNIEYAALSYCWGPQKDAVTQLKATKATLPQLTKGITEQSMTAILRDALTITRALSIPYLWVDALCILQDDTTEWEHQCADMDKIYGHAQLTLRANSARSCHEGFLQQKGVRIRMPFSSTTRPDIKGSYLLQLKTIGKERMFDVHYADQFQSPLYRRGWAYQEDVLSTRQLVFGASNVHFQCSHATFSRGFTYATRPETRRAVTPPNTLTSDDLYDEWQLILRGYSRYTAESFTKANDILPALSGLAALYGNRLKDDYLVGHWKGDLPRTLLWRRLGVKPKDLNHLAPLQLSLGPYISPSWSALGKGPTSWAPYLGLFRNFRPEVEYIKGVAFPEGDNSFGSVSSAQIEIRSRVFCMRSSRWELQSFIPDATPFARDTLGRVVKFGSGHRLVCHLDYDDVDEEQCSRLITDATLVLLGSNECQNQLPSFRAALGLLLRPTLTPGMFNRVGVFFPYWLKKDRNAEEDQLGDLRIFTQLAEVKTVVVV